MYAAYNGAVSKSQLKWLEETLCEAEDNKEKVIVAGNLGSHYIPEYHKL